MSSTLVDNDTLDPTDAMAVWDVNFDDKFDFNCQVSNMCKKAGRQFNVLQRFKGSLNDDYASDYYE